MTLDRLLRPRSIAVIGGGTWCENVIDQCAKIGFDGAIWPVHPKRETMRGVTVFRTVRDLPTGPDAAFVGINRDATIQAVQDLERIGAGGAICFASGFREADAETGNGLTKEIALRDVTGQMTILGPNCYGLLNYLDGVALWPDQHGGVRVDRGVALVMQSSNIAINMTMQDRALPIAYVVTVGNQMQTDFTTVGRALLRDERVTALGFYIEGIGDLLNFQALANEAHAIGKPVVVLKVGCSEEARNATVTHTGSLAGHDAGATALFERLGIGRVHSLPSFLETLKLLHVSGPLVSPHIASFSCSGGEANLMADTVHERSLRFPALTSDQKDALRNVLGERVALANPLDYHTYIWGDVDAMAATFIAVMRGDVAIGCVILDFPRSDRCDPSAWDPVIEAVVQTRAETQKPMVVVSTLKETFPEDVALQLIDKGITPLSGLDEAVTALEVAAQLGKTRPVLEPILLPPHGKPGRTLSESEAKTRLAAYGLSTPKSRRADSIDTVSQAVRDIGLPVVLKGEGIAHKTEAQAVRIGITSASEAEDAARAMPCSSFLIEQMITDTVVELLIGVVADPAHGYVLTLAAGGTLTELIGDRVNCLIPTDRDTIDACLQRLRIAPVLMGYRGKPAANREAILNAVMTVQRYVEAVRPHEVEINPLICGTKNAVAADALIRLGDDDD